MTTPGPPGRPSRELSSQQGLDTESCSKDLGRPDNQGLTCPSLFRPSLRLRLFLRLHLQHSQHTHTSRACLCIPHPAYYYYYTYLLSRLPPFLVQTACPQSNLHPYRQNN